MDGKGNDIIEEVPLSIVVTYESGSTLRGLFDKEANGWVFNETLETETVEQLPNASASDISPPGEIPKFRRPSSM